MALNRCRLIFCVSENVKQSLLPALRYCHEQLGLSIDLSLYVLSNICYLIISLI